MTGKKILNEEGIRSDELLAELKRRKEQDIKWRSGKNFAYIYHPGDEVLEAVRSAYNLYFSENALNPSAFPSLRHLEREVVEMVGNLFGGKGTTSGSMTSGGTESILMAVKSARSWAKKHRPAIDQPEIVLSATAHPAFLKACHYFGMKPRIVPTGPDHRLDLQQFSEAISDQTVLLIGSAPSYPHGLMDPIQDIAQLAVKHEILCHVDACVGGFLLPFAKMEGYPIPPFDFQLEGVTSISADIHKYGYAAKGASVIIYRSSELHKAQFYIYTDWPGGIYASPSIQGTRPGGAIAGAWMALNYLGVAGYRKLARQTMETAMAFQKVAQDIPSLQVVGQPEMSLFALTSTAVDIYEVGDELATKGWYMDRQQLPPTLHFTITPAHTDLLEQWGLDLREAVKKAGRISLQKIGKQAQLGIVRGMKNVLSPATMARLQKWAGGRLSVTSSGRQAAMYGMLGELQGEGSLDELVETLLHRMITEE
jgi:sphinganine-1-phosphate aldolase